MIKQNFKSYFRLFITPILLTPIIFLASCGGSSSSDTNQLTDTQTDFSNVSTNQAQTTAKNLIGTNVNTTLRSLGGVGTDSAAINTVAEMMGMDLSDSSTDPSTDDTSLTETMEQQILEAIELFFAEGVRVGDTITYNPDEQAMCNDAVMGLLKTVLELLEESDEIDSDDTSTAINECVALYSHVTIVLTILGEEEGTLAVKYDNFVILTIGYNKDKTYTEFDLAQLKSIIEAIGAQQDPPEDPELPSVFAGVFRYTNTVLGTDHGKMTFSIEQAINIVDDSEANETSISIGATPKFLEIIANANDNTASIELAIAAIDALFPLDDSQGIEQAGDLSIPGLTLLAELSSNGDQLIFSNIGIGNAPLVFDIVDLIGIEDFKLSLETFGFTIDGTQNTITFPDMFTALLEIDDQFDLLEETNFKGSLGLTVNDNTVLAPKQYMVGDDEVSVVEVTTGFVGLSITGDFGTTDVNFPTGSCITAGDDVLSGSPNIPLASASCN